jgi:hypothetical protein
MTYVATIVSLHWDLARGHQGLTRLYFRDNAGEPTSAKVLAAAQAAYTSACTAGSGHLMNVYPSDNVTFNHAEGVNADWALDAHNRYFLKPYGTVQTSVGAPVAGADTAAGSSPQIACLVSPTPKRAGRGGKPRIYLPALREGVIDSTGLITEANRAELQTNFYNLISAVQAGFTPDSVDWVGAYPGTSTSTGNRHLEVLTLGPVERYVATQRPRLRR